MDYGHHLHLVPVLSCPGRRQNPTAIPVSDTATVMDHPKTNGSVLTRQHRHRTLELGDTVKENCPIKMNRSRELQKDYLIPTMSESCFLTTRSGHHHHCRRGTRAAPLWPPPPPPPLVELSRDSPTHEVASNGALKGRRDTSLLIFEEVRRDDIFIEYSRPLGGFHPSIP